MTATCRAAWLQVHVQYSDQSSLTVASQPGSMFQMSTDQNPIRYTHLYHGEIVDNRINASWDQPGAMSGDAADWQPATAAQFVNADGAAPGLTRGGEMTDLRAGDAFASTFFFD